LGAAESRLSVEQLGWPQRSTEAILKTLTAGNVYRALWRHKLFILVLTAAFVAAVVYATVQQDREYEAGMLMRVQERGPTAGNASAALQASQDLAQTYAKIIGAGALRGEIRTFVAECGRRRASPQNPPPAPTGQGKSKSSTDKGPPAGSCESLGATGNSRLSPRRVSEVSVSASPVQDLDLLSITARSKDPTNARIAANSVPWALRAFIRNTGSTTEKIITVKAATTPSAPVSRHLALNIVIAIMLGLIFNGALALVLELFRDRLPEADELERAVGRPVLATIPSLRLHPVSGRASTSEEPVSVLADEQSSFDGERLRGPGARQGRNHEA
jgi:capsular polysaccharide biosynthesis protein